MFRHEAFGSNVKIKYRDIDKLLSHYVEVEEWFDYRDDFFNIDNLELVLG